MTAQVTDKLIAKAKELGLPLQTEDFLLADLAVTEAVQKAGHLHGREPRQDLGRSTRPGPGGRREDPGQVLRQDRQARLQAEKGIAKLAEQRTPPPAPRRFRRPGPRRPRRGHRHRRPAEADLGHRRRPGPRRGPADLRPAPPAQRPREGPLLVEGPSPCRMP